MSNDFTQTPTSPQGDRLAEARAQRERERAVNRKFALWIIAIILVIGGLWYFWPKGNGSSSSAVLSCMTGCSDAQFASAISAHEERLDADDASDKSLVERVAKLEKQMANRGPADLGRVRLDVYNHTDSVLVASSGNSKPASKPAAKPAKPAAKAAAKPAAKAADKPAPAAKQTPPPEPPPPAPKPKAQSESASCDANGYQIAIYSSSANGTPIYGVKSSFRKKGAAILVSPTLEYVLANNGKINPGAGSATTKVPCYPSSKINNLLCVNPIVGGQLVYDEDGVAVDVSDPIFAIQNGKVIRNLQVGVVINAIEYDDMPSLKELELTQIDGDWCAIVPLPSS